MKRILYFSALIAVLASSCNSKKPKTGEVVLTDGDGGKTTVNVSALETAAAASEKKTAELAKLTPYTAAEVKAFFPEELAGMKRSEYSSNAMMGFVTGEAKYKKDDSTSVELEVFDCAGEAGSSFYGLQYLAIMQTERETENEYMKTIDFNGGRGVETVYKNENRNTFTFFGGDRLMVTLKGENVPIDQIKSIASKLTLK